MVGGSGEVGYTIDLATWLNNNNSLNTTIRGIKHQEPNDSLDRRNDQISGGSFSHLYDTAKSLLQQLDIITQFANPDYLKYLEDIVRKAQH